MNDKLQTILSGPNAYNVTEEALSDLEIRWANVPDCNNEDGYALAIEGRNELRGVRLNVDEVRKELKRNINSASRSIMDRIVALEGPIADAIKKVNDAKKLKKERKAREEKERIEKIRGMIATIENAPNLPWNTTLEDAKAKLAEVIDTEILEDVFQEYTNEVHSIKSRSCGKLGAIIHAKEEEKEAAEQQRIEQERVAKEQAAERAKMEEERAAMAEQRRKAEEKAAQLRKAELEKVQVQQEEIRREKAKLAEQQMEQDRIAAEERTKLAEQQREVDRVAAEQQRKIDEENERKRIEAEKKEAKKQQKAAAKKNQELQAKNRDEIIDAMNSLESMGNVVDAIMAGDIPHVEYVG